MQAVAYQVGDCPICAWDLSEDIVNLGCGHVFHKQCIQTLMQVHPLNPAPPCPCCRRPTPRTDPRPVRLPIETHERFWELALKEKVLGETEVKLECVLVENEGLQDLSSRKTYELEQKRQENADLLGELALLRGQDTLYQSEIRYLNGLLDSCAEQSLQLERAAEEARARASLLQRSQAADSEQMELMAIENQRLRSQLVARYGLREGAAIAKMVQIDPVVALSTQSPLARPTEP